MQPYRFTDRGLVLPYKTIIERGQRRYTAPLLDLLQDPSLDDAERQKVSRCLEFTSDPRSFARLWALFLDATQPSDIRDAACASLRNMEYGPDFSEEELRSFWGAEDPVLQENALRSMGRLCPEIVLAVAQDPTHPLHAQAILRMEHYYELPVYQALKIKALSHPDATVREFAAFTLLWDEPIAAEAPLLACTYDAVEAVVVEACNTLKYYPTQKVLRRLFALCTHPSEAIREKANESFADLRGQFSGRLLQNKRFMAWLSPVLGLLHFTPEELAPESESPAVPWVRPTPILTRLSLQEVLALCTNPDEEVQMIREALSSLDWEAFSTPERETIIELFTKTDDIFLRSFAPRCFSAWKHKERLLSLLEDSDFSIRKSSMYYASELAPDPKIAEVAWSYLQKNERFGVHASETLRTYAMHANPQEANPRLLAMAQDESQLDSLRDCAVGELARISDREAVQSLSGILLRPPILHWGLHAEVVRAFRKLNLSLPDLSWLQEIDHLQIQELL
jgi:HEAT repeat protein